MDAKSFRVRFSKVDRIIKIYNGIKYLEISNSYKKFIIEFKTQFLIRLMILYLKKWYC